MDNFTFVGKLREVKGNDNFKGYEEKKFESGWTNRTLRFNVDSGTNSYLVQIKGGCYTDDKGNPKSDNVVNTMAKKNKDDKKAESVKIPWNDRKKDSWIEKVPAYKKCIIDNELPDARKTLYAIRNALAEGKALTDEQFAFLGVTDLNAAKEAESKRARHEYIAEWDFAEILNKFISKVGKDDMFRVSGYIEISYDVENSEAYKNYVVTKVERMPADVEPTGYVIIDTYFTKDAFDATDWNEVIPDGEVKPSELSGVGIVNAKQSYYLSNKKYGIKGTFYTDLVFEVPATMAGFALKFKLNAKFDKDVTWKHIPLKLKVVDGAPVVNLSYQMLTEEQKMDVDCGLYTLAELQASMSNIYGEKVRKYVFCGCVPGKGVEDTAYCDDEMVEAHPNTEEAEEISKNDDDIFA